MDPLYVCPRCRFQVRGAVTRCPKCGAGKAIQDTNRVFDSKESRIRSRSDTTGLFKTVSSVLIITLFVTLFLSLMMAAPGLGICVGFFFIPLLIQALTGKNNKMEIDDSDSVTSVLHATAKASANALKVVFIVLATVCIAVFAMVVALFLICFGLMVAS